MDRSSYFVPGYGTFTLLLLTDRIASRRATVRRYASRQLGRSDSCGERIAEEGEERVMQCNAMQYKGSLLGGVAVIRDGRVKLYFLLSRS